MRLTINLEEEHYRLAKNVALAEGCSISQAVNRLLAGASARNGGKAPKRRNGFPVAKARPFTSEEVYRIEQSQ